MTSDTDALPDRCRALWGGGDWTPRPGGGAIGRIGYLEIRVEVWTDSLGSWHVDIWRWLPRRRVWSWGGVGQISPRLEAAIAAAQEATRAPR